MSRRHGILGEVSWFQVIASVMAAVTAAFIASRLGVAGTLVGTAVGSAVLTISSALYGRTLDKGRTLLVTTASGTVIQRRVEDDDDIAETIEQAAEVDSPVRRGAIVTDTPSLHWKTIIATTVVVMALALAAITTYELATGSSLDGSGGTTLGDTFGGERGPAQPNDPATTPTPTATASTPVTTPTPTPTATTPTPTTPTDTPTPTPTATTPPAE
ncbi:hypothetical protein [Aeromicrobium sp. A1-2]|uniref:hypothetical protein n=1 Tax=Aeromicrobium sp. A1-2 TaxID=2107713 RepID=UPI0013C2C90D|nr:hypothetical protein [Aeromicrobium sp. A1-2]